MSVTVVDQSPETSLVKRPSQKKKIRKKTKIVEAIGKFFKTGQKRGI